MFLVESLSLNSIFQGVHVLLRKQLKKLCDLFLIELLLDYSHVDDVCEVCF
jgi:hypothetical protein